MGTTWVEFTFEGKTYRIPNEKALKAKVLILPTGALIGIAAKAGIPSESVQVVEAVELRTQEADTEEWTRVDDSEVVSG